MVANGARTGFGEGGQEWGFEKVREGAYTFYWLYYAGGGSSANGKPLVIWLQGGPGASSIYGDFVEIGPLDWKLNKRNTSWVDHVNVLFIDNPVGTGFSYVDSYSRLVTTNKQTSIDLVTFMKKFMKLFPDFETVPLYIFTESYGGRYTAQFAYDLYEERANGNIKHNLTAVALGDSWISPDNSTVQYAPYLLQLGLVDTVGFNEVDAIGQRALRELKAGRLYQAYTLSSRQLDVITDLAGGVDDYNILTEVSEGDSGDRRRRSLRSKLKGKIRKMKTKRGSERASASARGRKHYLKNGPDDALLNALIDDKVKPALNLTNYTYQVESNPVYNALYADQFVSTVDVVNDLLSKTNISVNVYSGQLDLIVGTLGTIMWVNNLTWDGIDSWKNATRKTLVVDNVIEAFYKKYDRLAFYWILRSGHMVPMDNPKAALAMMKQITEYDEY